MRGANSIIIPNREDHLECEECGMCIDICPVGALTSGTYRYKTRPWEMTYVSTVCTHCSNGCKTTLSVRNHEILRANNRDLSGINEDFLCIKGRFGFDFTKHPERLRQPMVRKGDKLCPVSWEEAAQTAATRLKQIHDAGGQDSIGFIGSNRTSNEENYLFQRLARATFGTNNIDHHRTADYTGLVTALGDGAGDSLLTMKQLAEAKAVLLVGNDPTNQNPLGCLADSQRNPAEWRETFHPERARYQVAAQGHAICEDGSVPGSSCDSLDGSRRGATAEQSRRTARPAESGTRCGI